MNISKEDLFSAASQAGINQEQVHRLWDLLKEKPTITLKFDLSHILYYIGASIVILAMSWFLGRSFEQFGGFGIFIISIAYIAFFIVAGSLLWHKAHLIVPGGLFITLAVSLIPLAVYGLQKHTGWWLVESPGQYEDFFQWIKSGWFIMEIATLTGGLIALWFYPFPFLTAPIFFVSWFMAMDATLLVVGQDQFDIYTASWASLFFGLSAITLAYLIDCKIKKDYAFWAYFFGTFAFWYSLTTLSNETELTRIFYCLINIGMILLSVLLQRTVFLVFGAMGVFWYITSLFIRYFSESTWFPFFLSITGVAVIFLGILYHRKKNLIEQKILNSLPPKIKSLLPQSRGN